MINKINLAVLILGYVVLIIMAVILAVYIIGAILSMILGIIDIIKTKLACPIAECHCKRCVYRPYKYCNKWRKNVDDDWFCADAKTENRLSKWTRKYIEFVKT